MSTLTKVLIILLTISSIFLCGIVVTYVANADNYKKQATDLRNSKNAAVEKEKSATNRLNQTIADAEKRDQELKDEINSLKIRLGELETQLTAAKRQTTMATEQESKWRDINLKFLETNDQLSKMLDDKLAELKSVDAMRIENEKELEETTASLIEKMAVIATLQKQLKQLLEEKTALQNSLNQDLQLSGKTVVTAPPVTQTREKAQLALPVENIGLKGLVTNVSLENSLAQISIGSASGVKQNMRFHVTRGDKFICDIVIFEVQPDKAVGTLELMNITQEQPKTGDNVSTNL